jgi:flagellar hook-associated protein 2
MASSTSSANAISLPNYAGVNFTQILQSVMAAGQVPIAALQQEVSGETTSISALGQISGDLTSLQSAIAPFQSGTATPLAAYAGAGAPFSTSVSGTPVAGVYSVTVNQMAAAQTSASQGYASNTDTVGTGTITVTVGGNANDIAINSGNNTLDGVANAINTAAIGVTAQVVNTGLASNPYRLEISSNSTGTAGAFTVSSSLSGGTAPDFTDTEVGPVSPDSMTGSASPTVGGTYTGTLSQGYHFKVTSGGTVGTDPITIAYTSDSGESGTINVASNYVAGTPLTVADGLTLSLGAGTLNPNDQFSVAAFNPDLASAQNAIVQAGNQIVTSASNSVTNAIPGVTLGLTANSGTSTVTVSQDTATQSNDISSFVNAYNQIMTDIQQATQAKPQAAAPPLAADAPVQAVALGMQIGLGTVNLSKLGISINDKTGQMSFNSAAFSAALTADPTGVQNAFNQLYTTLNGIVTGALAPNTGLIASQDASYNGLISQQNAQVTTLNQQLTQEQNQLEAEYAQMQALVENYTNMAQLFTDNSSSSSSSGSSSGGLGSLA